MKIKLLLRILTVFICITLWAGTSFAEEPDGCTTNLTYDREDSSGYHYDAFDSNGVNIGYITQSKENENMWYIWIKDEGDPNSQFETKIEALEELCKYSSGKIE